MDTLALDCTRSLKDDHHIDGSLDKEENVPLIFCIRQDIVHDAYLSLFYTEIKTFVKTFKPRGTNASTYYLLSIDLKHNNLVVGAR